MIVVDVKCMWCGRVVRVVLERIGDALALRCSRCEPVKVMKQGALDV